MSQSTPGTTLRAGQHSEAGRKAENQDSLGIRYPDGEALAIKGVAAVIADGVSSSEAGREAAEACVRGFLQDYYSTPDSWSVETSVSRVLGALNRWLHGRGHSHHGGDLGMVCTLSVLILKGGVGYVFHVGDSRVYRLRDGDLECLTRDHHIAVGRSQGVLARAMGVEPNVEIDVCRVSLEPGDRFLLTTDGIHEYVSHRELGQWAAHPDPETGARRLVRSAWEAGSTDNLSAQILAIEDLGTEDLTSHYQRLTALPFPPPLVAGQRFDGYRIIRELHASKRSQVYLAAPESGGEPVVIKTPSPNYVDDPAYIDSFLMESWIARRVESPHLVRFVEPPTQRRCLYWVSEYVNGPTLRQWMQDHPNPGLSRVRDIIAQIAMGLRALHRMEMVHQDVKPENIVIDEDGTVKLIDLGAVRIRGIDQIPLPWAGDGYLGTASYAAPESLDGELVSPAADRYALGVIAYEMLTGELPYKETPVSSRRSRLRYRSARHWNPDLPVWLDGCLEKAVAFRVEDRYPALSEFLRDFTYPNPALARHSGRPLMDRVTVEGWRALALISLAVNGLMGLWLIWG